VSRIDIVKRLFEASEANNPQEYMAFFTDNAVYQIGNAKPITGPKGIQQLASDVMQSIRHVSHDIKKIWETADGVVLCQAQVTYTRKDGKVFELPCMTIVRFIGNKIHKYQAFIDASPVFSPTKLEKVMAMQAAAAQGNWELFKSFLTEDIYFKVGSAQELIGPQAVADYCRELQLRELRITGAEAIGVWEVENAVIVEMGVQAERIGDGKIIEYPSVDSFRFQDDRVHEWRIYPVYSIFMKVDV
jgi:ketosteroid isomerase-like protein